MEISAQNPPPLQLPPPPLSQVKNQAASRLFFSYFLEKKIEADYCILPSKEWHKASAEMKNEKEWVKQVFAP